MSVDKGLAEIQARVAFGLDVQQFMGTSMGQYLQARANSEIEAAKDALVTVDPEDLRAVRNLQNDAKAAAMFLDWMGQAVDEGKAAEWQWQASENN